MRYFDLCDVYSSLCWLWNNEIKTFEKKFADYIGVDHAIGTSYGRTALYLGLRAVNVEGKEVILPTFICTVVRHAVIMAGAIPKFVDINFDTFEYNIADLKQKITTKTCAVLLTHYFGNVASNLREIQQLAKDNNLVFIEDCAHSLGAEFQGKKVGSFGDFSIFSLTKNMVNLGGGVLVTNKERIAKKAKIILNEERRSLIKRISDFPFIMSYGYEQLINKTVFDRVKKNIFMGVLEKLPLLIMRIRKGIIKTLKTILFMHKRQVKLNKAEIRLTTASETQIGFYDQSIHMEPILASVGLNQLKKIDDFNNRKRRIYNALLKNKNSHFSMVSEKKILNVCSSFVFNINNRNIFEFIKTCKEEGLLLRATWPTHQKIWENQQSENINRIKDSILTWNINPDVSDRELYKLEHIINNN